MLPLYCLTEAWHVSIVGLTLTVRRNTIDLTLHTGVLSKTFAIKSCTNPAWHIFPWLPGEAVGLHMGVLTKTFAMSVLYLKTIDVFFKRKSFDKSVH